MLSHMRQFTYSLRAEPNLLVLDHALPLYTLDLCTPNLLVFKP